MATVIKYNAPSARSLRPRTFELKDHVAQATALVEAARLRSQRMVQEAERQAVLLREQAAREGYVSGHRKGFEEGRRTGHAQAFAEATVLFREDQSHLVNTLRSALDEVEQRKRDLLIHAKQDVMELALRIARRITHRLGRADPTVVVESVSAACKVVSDKTDLTLRVHPSDAATLRKFSSEWTPATLDWRHITLVEDEALSPGGCIVSTSVQEIDARLETQLDEITSMFVAEPTAACPAGSTPTDKTAERGP